MLAGLICPLDGKSQKTEHCLTCCKCLPEPIIRKITYVRKPGELPSVTTLLSPTRYRYLEQKHDYYEKPADLMFRIVGSANHYFLEGNYTNHLTEERLACDIFTGQVDCYDGNTFTLHDYKFFGGYKQKMLRDSWEKEGREITLQTNAYRYLLEKAGFPVKRIEVIAITQDFRNYEYKQQTISYSQGKIDKFGKAAAAPIERFYRFPVQIMALDAIYEHMKIKYDALKEAQSTGYAPKCSIEDTWGGKRCEGYCPISEYCLEMSMARSQMENQIPF